MIDTHAHLYADEFLDDIDKVVDNAKQAGVSAILLPNIDVASINGLNKLVNDDSDFFKRMMGLHPCSVDADYKDQLAVIKKELEAKECIAIGEIGIDLHWDKSKRTEQEDAFRIQCDWAVEMQLPIAIHSRESTDIIIDIIKNEYAGKLSGVFHCFGGSLEQANQIIKLGFYLGIGGVVTFKNSKLRDVLKSVPLDRIVMETDSPYLAPVPFRGKRNESAYLAEVCRQLSFIYDCNESHVKEVTTINALKLFKL